MPVGQIPKTDSIQVPRDMGYFVYSVILRVSGYETHNQKGFTLGASSPVVHFKLGGIILEDQQQWCLAIPSCRVPSGSLKIISAIGRE